MAEAAARLLVEVDGIHALVGPNASSAALPISQNISGLLGIPTISPSATSPQLSDVEDDGYFFRTALSDAAQGPVLAQVTRDRGFDNVGLIFQDDAWGKGLATTFEEAWDGTLQAVTVSTSQTSFLDELAESAASEVAGIGRHRIRRPGPDHRARGYRRRHLQPASYLATRPRE